MLQIINQALNPDFSAVSEQITETLWGSTSLSVKGGSWIKIVLKAHITKCVLNYIQREKKKRNILKNFRKAPFLRLVTPIKRK